MKKMCSSSSSVLLVSLCLLLCLSTCLSSGVTVKPGDDATLQCRGSAGTEIKLLKWTKPEMESKHYVFFYRDNRLHEDYLHHSYRGRVELKDPEMKNRDVSVVLKNVTTNDTGRYECYVKHTGGDLEFTGSFNLTVTDSGDTEERGGENPWFGLEVGQIALFVVGGVIAGVVGGVVGGGVVGLVVFTLIKKHRKLTNESSREFLTA